MNAKATIYEVARLSSVSTATVSRVMHDGGGFSEATRKAVLESAATLDATRGEAGIAGLPPAECAVEREQEQREEPDRTGAVTGCQWLVTRARCRQFPGPVRRVGQGEGDHEEPEGLADDASQALQK